MRHPPRQRDRRGRWADIDETTVSHGQDAGSEENGTPLQTFRVARPVEAFVMLQDHLGDRPRKGDVGHDLRPGLGMSLDDLELRHAQPAGPSDLCGNGDLTDVMERGRYPDTLTSSSSRASSSAMAVAMPATSR